MKKILLGEFTNKKRLEQLQLHKKFLMENIKKVRQFAISGKDLDPSKISLTLIEARPDSLEAVLFFWWNLAWWSVPFDRPVGRQMRFILWDDYHNAPFGLVGLQSPPLRSYIRDSFLGLSSRKNDYWINQSMYAQRIGALPPYNELLGGKMAALSLVCNELKRKYAERYRNKETLLKKRKIPNHLLFVSTTSAYGKSSVYERLTYCDQIIGQFLGFTRGSGTFHISEPLYQKILLYLKQSQINVKRGYGTGSSRKLQLVDKAFARLKIPNFTFHNIKRGYYLFSNVTNLQDVIHKKKRPVWYNRPFQELADFWKERWCIPRSYRKEQWKTFRSDIFFRNAETEIKSV